MPASPSPRQPDHQTSVFGAQLQEWWLGRLVAGCEDPLGRHLAEVLMIPLVGHAIAGQWLLGELDRYLLLGDPDRRWPVSEPAFPIDAAVPEADVPGLVNSTGTEDRREAVRQLLIAEDTPCDPLENLGRASPTILPLQVRPMLLPVVVVDSGCVPLEQLVPGGRSAEVVVGHPPLDLGRGGLGGQDLLDRRAAGSSLEADLANRGQLVGTEGRSSALSWTIA